ncbi:hypothetical protein HJFPF1_00453 [Paramyrothecium foliicola]|nr:hypothetical protein HJFPF1_00453 [Paramyrothecium foliicola]
MSNQGSGQGQQAAQLLAPQKARSFQGWLRHFLRRPRPHDDDTGAPFLAGAEATLVSDQLQSSNYLKSGISNSQFVAWAPGSSGRAG